MDSAEIKQEFQILTKETARKQRAALAEGYLFPMTLTGGAARVRIPSLADKAFLNLLPENAQKVLARELMRLSDSAKPAEDQEQTQPRTNREAWDKVKQNASDMVNLSNELAKICFMDPRVVETREESDLASGNVLALEDIHIEDRLNFAALVMRGEEYAHKRLKLFRSIAPEPVDTLPPESGYQAPTAP